MNNSGDAVRAIVDWYKINLDQIFIIVDDKVCINFAKFVNNLCISSYTIAK